MLRSFGPRIANRKAGNSMPQGWIASRQLFAAKTGISGSTSPEGNCQIGENNGRACRTNEHESCTAGSIMPICSPSAVRTTGSTTAIAVKAGPSVQFNRQGLGLNTIKEYFMARSCIISNVKTTMFRGPKDGFPAIDRNHQRAQVSRSRDGDRHNLAVTKQTNAGRSLLLQLSQVRELRGFLPTRVGSLSGKRAHHTIDTPCLSPFQDRRPRSGWLLDVMILLNRTIKCGSVFSVSTRFRLGAMTVCRAQQ